MTLDPSVSGESPRGDVTVGILAGGQASRLGGIDKGWLERDGAAQIVRIATHARQRTRDLIVSANRDAERHAALGLRVVGDRTHGIGPIGGLDALAEACTTTWLVTLPVDLVRVEAALDALLDAAGDAAVHSTGIHLEDDDGPQPLAACWPITAMQAAIGPRIASGEHAVHALQGALGMRALRLRGVRLGNLNTPADLAAAGIVPT